MKIKNVVIVLLFIVLCQGLLGIYQLKKYDKFIKNLQDKYKGCGAYYLLSEKVGNKFRSLIIIVIMDNSSNIIEAYSYSGNTVFSQFKEIINIENQNINLLLNKERTNKSEDNMSIALEQVKKNYDEILGEKSVS